MKHDQGFTLTETLVALLVISLSLAALITAASLVAHFDHHDWAVTKEEKQLARQQDEIAAILHAREPLRSDDLVGAAKRFDYACRPHSKDIPDCHFTLSAGNIPNLHMMYVTQGQIRSDWPPEPKSGEIEPPRIEALILQDGQNTTRAVIKLDVEQDKDCQFDMISRTCRQDYSAPTSSAAP